MKNKKYLYIVINVAFVVFMFLISNKNNYGILSQIEEITNKAVDQTSTINIDDYFEFNNVITAIAVLMCPQIGVLLMRKINKKAALISTAFWIFVLVLNTILFANEGQTIGFFKLNNQTQRIIYEGYIVISLITTLCCSLLGGPWQYCATETDNIKSNIFRFLVSILLAQITLFIAAIVLLMLL